MSKKVLEPGVKVAIRNGSFHNRDGRSPEGRLLRILPGNRFAAVEMASRYGRRREAYFIHVEVGDLEQ